jgi:hypothetical protein
VAQGEGLGSNGLPHDCDGLRSGPFPSSPQIPLALGTTMKRAWIRTDPRPERQQRRALLQTGCDGLGIARGRRPTDAHTRCYRAGGMEVGKDADAGVGQQQSADDIGLGRDHLCFDLDVPLGTTRRKERPDLLARFVSDYGVLRQVVWSRDRGMPAEIAGTCARP